MSYLLACIFPTSQKTLRCDCFYRRMIVAEALTKNYGEQRAVDDLSFTVQPGVVTGFLGPNGSGKSTTMR